MRHVWEKGVLERLDLRMEASGEGDDANEGSEHLRRGGGRGAGVTVFDRERFLGSEIDRGFGGLGVVVLE